MTNATMTRRGAALSERVFTLVERIAGLPDLKVAVETNHDDNRWWPASVTDPRMRMLVAGWSTRVSYAMVDTYAQVVAKAARIGFDDVVRSRDDELIQLIRPIGLPAARLTYLRSLTAFLLRLEREGANPLNAEPDDMIRRFADEVDQASYKEPYSRVRSSRRFGVLT